MAKPITDLTKDIRKLIEDGRAAAGPEIIFSLQHAGPWWTEKFGRSWKLSQRTVRAIEHKKELNRPGIPPEKGSPRPSSKVPALVVDVNSPLYIGNSVAYAGFAVNNPGAVVGRPEFDNATVTYKQHKTGTDKTPKFKLTSKGQDPDWYKVYTLNGGLFRDLDKGFASVRLG
mgnify:FL=1|tara:strand:- start:140 stop:655 length:516 start_codon:yes stop_codon:yes gene_type:complete